MVLDRVYNIHSSFNQIALHSESEAFESFFPAQVDELLKEADTQVA